MILLQLITYDIVSELLFTNLLTLEYYFNEASDKPYIHLLSFPRYPSIVFDSGGGIINTSINILSVNMLVTPNHSALLILTLHENCL